MRLLLISLLLTALAPAAQAARTPLKAYLAGNFSLAVRDFDAATRQFGMALAATPDDQLLRRRAFELALTSGNFDQAVSLAQAIAKTDDSISSVNQVLVLDAMRRKDWVTASRMSAQMPEAGIDAIVVPLIKCWVAVGKGDLPAATAALDTLERSGGMAGLRQYESAWVAAISGNIAAARPAFIELTKSPRQAGLNNLIALASLMNTAGDRDGAIKLLSFDAEDRLAVPIQQALMKLKTGKPLPLPLRTPQDGLASAFSVLAVELARDDIRGAAINLARMAVWISPEQVDIKLALADILSDADRARESRAVLESIAPERAELPDVVMARARSLARDEMPLEALKLVEMAIAKQPGRIDLLTTRADLLRAADRNEDAATAYTAAIARLPRPFDESSWSIFFARAVCHEQLKKWDETEADLKQALALRPDDPALLNYLGYSWLEQRRNVAEATKMIERALELRPGDGATIDSLGWAYFIAGDNEKAIEYLEQSIAAVPGDPTVNEHLGDVYWAVGRIIEARHRWAAALASDPDKSQSARLADKLEFGLSSGRSMPS